MPFVTRSPYGYETSRRGSTRGRGLKMRLILALVIAGISLLSYLGTSVENPITGERQRVAMTEQQEIAMGLQARGEMAQQHGDEHPDRVSRARVDQIGNQLLTALNRDLQRAGRKNPYPFEFHLLRDPETVNAFALPGGQVFITWALYNRLQTEGQLAGVLGHEIGHVLMRHGAQRLAKQKLTQGLVGAAGVAGGDINSARLAQAIGELVNMKYGREDELESDSWGVRLCVLAGFDPYAMIGVMKILDESTGGEGPPEMLSTHPKPANRVKYIEDVIHQQFPDGLPDGLEK